MRNWTGKLKYSIWPLPYDGYFPFQMAPPLQHLPNVTLLIAPAGLLILPLAYLLHQLILRQPYCTSLIDPRFCNLPYRTCLTPKWEMKLKEGGP